MAIYCLQHNSFDPKRTISLYEGENVIGRGSACRILYPFCSFPWKDLNNTSLQCSRKQAVITTQPPHKSSSLISEIMQDRQVIGTYACLFSCHTILLLSSPPLFYLVLLIDQCRITATGIAPVFIRTPKVDTLFRRLSRNEQSPLYRCTEICLYTDAKEGVQVYTLRPVKAPTISTLTSETPSSKRTKPLPSSKPPSHKGEWKKEMQCSQSKQACYHHCHQQQHNDHNKNDHLSSLLSKEEYIVHFILIHTWMTSFDYF